MASRVKDVIKQFEQLAPKEYAEKWDNVGLMLGSIDSNVQKILVTLDVTLHVVNEAIEKGIDLIIAHHNPMFNPLANITLDNPQGKLITKLIKSEINLYCAHTNLDSCPGGVNDILADLLELTDVKVLDKSSQVNTFDQNVGLGRVGILPQETSLLEFIKQVKAALNIDSLRYVGNLDTKIKKVSLCGGSAASLINDAINIGADVFLTGDLKFHEAQDAENLGICLIDAGHFATEVPVVKKVAAYLQNSFSELEIIESKINTEPFKFI
ncbi:dinuclear metal center protein, YbgI/SA1388 family [Desulfonispora thiosulfatigenes DSM 11270]|uniref:GTP cyclohydrolase 1 type 2 homolog n=2 Tax=Desulfonispora thiosulfatigenes TaxID=83661 RepID=A0A1W1V9H6_DESTI|nr:dinuclear metal center protein, YbgI/SA1388 family [Desulfonispora thiosulfatigenes DSM 11270]